LYPTPRPNAHPLFPTRRSSDLCLDAVYFAPRTIGSARPKSTKRPGRSYKISLFRTTASAGFRPIAASELPAAPRGPSTWLFARRSEEHTSELQSRENLVCRLLL